MDIFIIFQVNIFPSPSAEIARYHDVTFSANNAWTALVERIFNKCLQLSFCAGKLPLPHPSLSFIAPPPGIPRCTQTGWQDIKTVYYLLISVAERCTFLFTNMLCQNSIVETTRLVQLVEDEPTHSLSRVSFFAIERPNSVKPPNRSFCGGRHKFDRQHLGIIHWQNHCPV